MSTGSSKTRTQRLASIAAVHTNLHQTVTRLRKKSSIFCFLIFFSSFILLILANQIWNPPFPYYVGMALNRDVVARVGFETTDTGETEKERVLAANRVPNVYVLDNSPDILKENIDGIYKLLKQASSVESLEQLSPELQQQFRVPDVAEDSVKGTLDIWQFLRNTPEQPEESPKDAVPAEETIPTEETPVGDGASLSRPQFPDTENIVSPQAPTEEFPEIQEDSKVPSDVPEIVPELVPTQASTTKILNKFQRKFNPVSHSVMKISPELIQTTSSTLVPQSANEPNPVNFPKEEAIDSGVEVKDEAKAATENVELLAVSREKRLSDFCDKLEEVMRQFTSQGLMHVAEVKEDPLGRGLQVQISIVSADDLTAEGRRTALKSVILEDNEQIHEAIRNIAETPHIGSQIYYCICRNWKSNLVFDSTMTNQAIQNARQSVLPVKKIYQATQRIIQMPAENDVLVGTLLTEDQVNLLRIEDEKWHSVRTLDEKIRYGVSTSLFLLFCLIPIWAYIVLTEPRILHELSRLIFVLAFSLVTLLITTWFFQMPTMTRSSGLFPLIIFSQVLTIQYRRRVGILITGVMILCLAVTLNMTSMEIICDAGILLVAILPFDRLRGRLQFIQISIITAITAFLLFVCMDLMMSVPLNPEIFQDAILGSLPLILAGLVIQSFLPLLERWLGILSDVRLMELCDVSNPLLNELINRAPSTYSHSIALGTLGENAADAIGANGLLVRTAAYYHDIGKIYKPSYYAENLIVKEDSPHNSLEPSMSALIIIAHVKNGVDLARQYKLPQQIIDLIEQHHGSGLVTYFYRQAQKRHLEDPTIPEPEEISFRYPCPKPQTKEAVVLMMTDACESASRSLVEPTPARIQGLVRNISQERLEDEQFDESGITLTELRTIEASIVKGLISLHHGRIKYPDKIEKKR